MTAGTPLLRLLPPKTPPQRTLAVRLLAPHIQEDQGGQARQQRRTLLTRAAVQQAACAGHGVCGAGWRARDDGSACARALAWHNKQACQ